MKQEPTVELEGILQKGKITDFTKYCSEHIEGKIYEDFESYISDYIQESKISRKAVIQRADLPMKYGYDLLNGTKHTKSRDKIIRICIGCKMTAKDCSRALKLYGMSPLYAKNERDVLIILALNEHNLDVDDISELLLANGYDELEKSAE